MTRRLSLLLSAALLAACGGQDADTETREAAVASGEAQDAEARVAPIDTMGEAETASREGSPFADAPLVTEIFTADPSAHVWDDGRIYIYPSHDYDAGIPEDDLGSQYAMRDYRVLSMDEPGGEVTVHDVALDVDDVPWAAQQMWAPDAAEKDGRYYLYFPAKDEDGVFYIGAAVSDSPTGPFTAEPEPIEGTYSMDPSVFEDEDGAYYLYFGGIWGGQLQRWATGEYDASEDLATDLVDDDPTTGDDEADQPEDVAIMPRVARLGDDMVSLAEAPREAMILDEEGEPVLARDHDRRFFEAAWVNRVGDTYILSYSTGDTHKIAYATGDDPYGPFTYRGVVLEPVQGWTNHHSIAEVDGQYYLFYHDTELSNKSHLRNVKMRPIEIAEDGTITTEDVFSGD